MWALRRVTATEVVLRTGLTLFTFLQIVLSTLYAFSVHVFGRTDRVHTELVSTLAFSVIVANLEVSALVIGSTLNTLGGG